MRVPAGFVQVSPRRVQHPVRSVVVPPVARKNEPVASLTAHQGRVWVGYGDWGANTGPVEIVSIGPDGDIQTHVAAPPAPGSREVPFDFGAATLTREGGPGVPTENIEYVSRPGWLAGLWVDPLWYWGPGGFTARRDGGDWQHHVMSIDMVHCLDFAVGPDGSWWVAGSQITGDGVGQALVYRSPDEGATWVEAHRSVKESPFTRHCLLEVVDGAVVTDDPDGGGHISTVDNGVTWTPAPAPPRRVKTEAIAAGHRFTIGSSPGEVRIQRLL